MRTLLLVFLFLPLALRAQNRETFIGLDAAGYFLRGLDPAPGFHLSGSVAAGKGIYLGAQLGLVHFRDLRGAYVPVQMKFTFLPSGRSGRAYPLVFLEPGFGFHDHKYRDGNRWRHRRGGFNFFGGVGGAFATGGKARLTLAIGYARFGFEDDDYRFAREGVGLRLGALVF